MDYLQLAYGLNGLSVYRDAADCRPVALLKEMILAAETAEDKRGQLAAAECYGALCRELYESGASLYRYVLERALYSDNVFSRAAAAGTHKSLAREVLAAAASDLGVLFRLASATPQDIKKYLSAKCPTLSQEAARALPSFALERGEAPFAGDWSALTEAFAGFYAAHGVGMYAKYRAFRYETGVGIAPVRTVDPIRLADLKKYEAQRKKIVDNTLAFLAGAPYNNVLLYGDRGTGKSSTVKALLNEFGDRKLRMIEIGRRCIADLDKLIALVSPLPMKFILFIDDLTFNENDDNFNILKAVLEGSLAVRPDNVAIYATTNRRHLIKETFSAREGNEVHRGDTLDESLSLSDRFGLTVTFMKPNKDEFLEIVIALAADRGLCVDREALLAGAERFALVTAGRSPRVARQYVDQLEAKLKLDLD